MRSFIQEILYTYGHGTESPERTIEILQAVGIKSLIDIRTGPGSRRCPWFCAAEMARWLPEAGIAYRHEKRLGGFRKCAACSPDIAWKHQSFRGYAGYMRDAEFIAAMNEVLAEASAHPTAVMCSESVWWRCHRRLVADFVKLTRGVKIQHIMHDGSIREHHPIDGVSIRKDNLLIYDGLGTRSNRALPSRKITERIRKACQKGHLMRNPMINHIQKALSDNLPQILSGVAVAGVIGTAVLAVKATPKAMADIAQAKENKAWKVADDEQKAILATDADEQKLTPTEIVQATWRCYVPAALCGLATVTCVIGSNAIGLRRNAALLAAYTLADTSFREYKDKVIEHVTAQKAQKIDDELMEDRIKKNPPKPETIIVTGGGDQLCYESLTGRYFKSNPEAIRRAAQDFDARILQGDVFASLNEWFQELGLDSTNLGLLMGFNIECRLKVVFSSHLNECDQPILAIDYEKLPVYNYDKW